jgi:cytidylate kinase
MHAPRLTIAIDGYSSCGKSTLAKAIAKKLSYVYVDSGAMYRAIALFLDRQGKILNGHPILNEIDELLESIKLEFRINPETGNQELFLNGLNVEQEIRSPQIAGIVSPVAAVPEIRHKLVELQRELGKTGGIVMDGRDIGSVVFPYAEVKFFVTAEPDVRAQRRYLELREKGIHSTLEETRENLLERDRIDSTRQVSPLIRTEDAILLDNSHITKEEQLEFALEKINEKMHEINEK